MTTEVIVICAQELCMDEAVGRFFWPGREPSAACEKHLAKARGVADALGMYLHVEPLPQEEKP